MVEYSSTASIAVKNASLSPKPMSESDLGNDKYKENKNNRLKRFLGRIINRLNTLVVPPKKHMLNIAAIMDMKICAVGALLRRFEKEIMKSDDGYVITGGRSWPGSPVSSEAL